MSDAKRQRVEALREKLSASARAQLAQRLAAGARGGAPATDDAAVARAGAPTVDDAAVDVDLRARSQAGFEIIVRAGAAAAADVLPADVIDLELAASRSDDAHARALVCRVLDRLGYRVGDACSPGEVLRRAAALSAKGTGSPGGAQTYTKLVTRWLIELAQAGIVERTADHVGVLTARYTECLQHHSTAAMPAYWPRSPEELLAVLCGTLHPLELMERAGGIFETVTGYHRDTPRSRYYNAVVATLVRTYAAALDPQVVRVLEVGAGVGGTTGAVLDALPAERSTYCFTDISSAFFEFARAQLGHRPNVVYRVLNLNDEPSKHGLADGDFDLILAANAIHCARDLGATLRSLRRLLAGGGMLVLRELTTPHAAHAIMPGLMPGFSDFSDQRLAASSPLLSKDAWRQALLDATYDAVTALPDAGPCDLLGEHVLVARKPTA